MKPHAAEVVLAREKLWNSELTPEETESETGEGMPVQGAQKATGTDPGFGVNLGIDVLSERVKSKTKSNDFADVSPDTTKTILSQAWLCIASAAFTLAGSDATKDNPERPKPNTDTNILTHTGTCNDGEVPLEVKLGTMI